MFSRAMRPARASLLTASRISACSARPILPLAARTLSTTPAEPSGTSIPPSSSAAPSPAAAASSQAQSQQTTPSQREQLPYYIGRNNFNNLSIYQLNKRGGNLKLTVLKRVDGNLQALKQDLREALNLATGDVSIGSVTNHIVIKGHRKDEVTTFVQTLGF